VRRVDVADEIDDVRHETGPAQELGIVVRVADEFLVAGEGVLPLLLRADFGP
jgi:hypothetical protein